VLDLSRGQAPFRFSTKLSRSYLTLLFVIDQISSAMQITSNLRRSSMAVKKSGGRKIDSRSQPLSADLRAD
jgi:hypothetical protein